MRYEIFKRHKTTTFHWLLHTRFCDLVRWAVVIDAMLKQGLVMLPVGVCLFFVALWSPAGKGLASWLSCVLCFVNFQMSSGPHQNQGWGWRRETGLSPPVKYFTDRSKAVLLLWIVFVGYASCWYVLFYVAFWSPAGKGLTSWLQCVFCFVNVPNVLWSTSESRVRLVPWNWFKPSSKIFYWYRPFQGGTSFVDLLCFCSVLCLLCLCARLFICALWSPAGKGLTSWLLFVVSAVSLSLSHWYPGSGVVLDCIDSWSLHPYLLCKKVHIQGFVNEPRIYHTSTHSLSRVFSPHFGNMTWLTESGIFRIVLYKIGKKLTPYYIIKLT